MHKDNFKSRKRTRNPQSHKETKRKKLVQLGEEHVSKSGSKIKGKVFHGQEICKCKRNCSGKIDVQRQRDIFDEFYRFENWSKKRLFLWSLVQSHAPKAKVVPVKQLKKILSTNSYYLSDHSGITHQVCLHFLINCLQISKKNNAQSHKLKNFESDCC